MRVIALTENRCGQFAAAEPDGEGWRCVVFTAFVIDVFSRKLVGWRVSKNMKTDFVLDTPEQAIYARDADDSLIHPGARPWFRYGWR